MSTNFNMMDKKRIWAKSCPSGKSPNNSMYLLGHLQDVHNAAISILDATGDAQLQAFGLVPEQYRDRFRRIVLLAAAVHDLGKANDHFQGMLLRMRNILEQPQGLRHEWATLLMMQDLKTWLLPAVGSGLDFAFVEWSVSGHHPGQNHACPPRTCPPGAGTEIHFRIHEQDFTNCLNWIGKEFGLEASIPAFTSQTWGLVGVNNVYGHLTKWFKNTQQQWEKSVRSRDDAKLLAAVKNCLIAADVAGSALPREINVETERWKSITNAFAAVPEIGDLSEVVKRRLNGKEPRPFQQAVAQSPTSVTFVKSGCGSGKTLAAYMWAANNHPTHRLYFCYPTTGTATEGFKDYLFEPEAEMGGLGAKLFHSRSHIDHEIILSNSKDTANSEAEETIKADALESWSTPIVACTVDTVLGIVQNNKRGLFAWPALSQSAFVFDEIHAFDNRLFGALLRFLRDLPGLPVLLMTASLPEPRQAALTDVLKDFRNIELYPISGPKELEELPRYHQVNIQNNDPLQIIEATLKAHGKVLWVCNTVARVMQAASQSAKYDPLIYHSRFKYLDRVARHKAVIEAFQGDQPALAICSQVAEMSLDLSADLLVTDLATVPALIQRLGRLNRRAQPPSHGNPNPRTKPLIVIDDPEQHLPYEPDDLDIARAWLKRLPTVNISQCDLATAWEQSAENPPDLVPSAWLDGGPCTTVTELREASPGITVIMSSDRSHIQKASDLGKFTLPMPPPPSTMNWQSWPKERGIPVADDNCIEYDQLRGAAWQNV